MSSGNIITPIPSDTTPPAADVQNPPQATQSIAFNVFMITSKRSSDDDTHWETEGWLYQGFKTIAGTSQNGQIVNGISSDCVYYLPSFNGEMGPQIDISHDVTSKEVPANIGTREMSKVKSPLAPWSFDIAFSNFGAANAVFIGTMIKDDGPVWDLKGSYLGPTTQELQVTVVPATMAVPNLNDGTSPASLHAISPIVTVGTPGFQVGEDGAQICGNTIMQNLMMHSLINTQAESVVGSIMPVTDVEQLEIYMNNKEFFLRGGVHMLCDYLKKQTQIPPGIVDHIEWKNNIFIAMCSQPTTPPPSNGQKTIRTSWDPARMYGLDPNNNPADATLIATLQSQYRQATMDCYALGYRQQCNGWNLYEKNAEAWFNYYAYYITTPEALQRMAVLSTNAPGIGDGKRDGPSFMREIVNKLTTLKHAAESNAQKAGRPKPNLDVDGVVKKNEAALNENMAYSMYITDGMVDEAKTLLGQGSKNPALATAFQTQLEKMQDETSVGANDLAVIAVNTLELINNPNTRVGKIIRKWWQKRRTPGVLVNSLTVAQAIQALELADFAPVLQQVQDPADVDTDQINQLAPDGPPEKAINEAGQSILNRLGKGFKAVGNSGEKWIGPILRVGVHVAAIAFMCRTLEGGLSQCLPGEIGAAVCVTGMAGLSLAGKLAGVSLSIGRTMGWASTEVRLFHATRTWFCQRLQPAFSDPPSWSKVHKAFVGDFNDAVGALGLISCIFGIVVSAEAMSQAGSSPNDPIAKREDVFTTVNGTLGSVELACGIPSVFSDVAGFEVLGAVCGPLGLVVGFLSIGVNLTDTISFLPDAFQDLEDWMTTGPVQYGSYDWNQTFTGEPSLTVTLPPIQISKVATEGTAGSQNGNATNNGSKNQNDGGNSDNSTPKPTASQVTAPQQAAAQRMTTALQTFSDKVSEFQSSTYAVSSARLYAGALSTFIELGLTWEPANLNFQISTNDFVTAYNFAAANSLWEIQLHSTGAEADPSAIFMPLVDEINNSYTALQTAMSVSGS
ncbi:hypothetical protein NW768_001036 [Fusarium equiseti]|uniref:Uncharacterized protein n=1 Tax=Fusarium equiseti TaxID=61235 RepID=A0ABQ8RP45_FUSEQ|nr:hypothetical protein NW768_001036 [Fusarium equiseti]